MTLHDIDIFKQHIKKISELQEFEECGEAVQYFCSMIVTHFKNNNFNESLKLSNELYDLCWEKLHTGHWSSVRLIWRDAFAFSTWLTTMNKIKMMKQENLQQLQEIMKLLDLGIMMGGDRYREDLHDLVEQIHSFCVKCYGYPSSKIITEQPQLKRKKYSDNIQRISNPSLTQFIEKFYKPQIPVIITQAIDDWPAINSWQNLDYFKQIAGYRIVPVEIGTDYVSKNWTQKLMTFNDYIDKYIETDNEIKGYLAQHQLFEHIRPLKKDIIEPLYCAIGELQSINAWFGPKHTISPLHTDRFDNVLCQVVGSKYIRLYHPKETQNLYPHGQGLLYNTSRIRDVFYVDEKKFPNFHKAPFIECILKKGEMLFIPKMWWHYVESLSTSFSVSFWWQ
jgi:hypothetical protein